jgi:hypothetical protein
MRELFEQFIAYGRAYADSLASYEPDDDFLSRANVGFSKTISEICDAIDYGGVVARASALPPGEPPSTAPVLTDPSDSARFITEANSVCVEWIKSSSTFTTSLEPWTQLDPEIAATQWNPEQRAVQEAAARTMHSYANSIEILGRKGANPTMEDLAALAASYLRAYSLATPSYRATDNYVAAPGLRLNNAISAACQAGVG